MRVLYTFGLNEDGQCGVPIRAEHNGRYFPIPVAFPLKVSITSVSAGSRHTLALASNGDVFSWGWGHLGQLGHGDARNLNVPTKICTIMNATFISAGGVHSACIDKDNYCYTWGSCTYGQLGLGKEVTETRKCIVSSPQIVTLRPDGDVKGSAYYKNKNIDSSSNVASLASLANLAVESYVKNALRVSRVSCGGLHTAAIDLHGNVYCWGKADSGQTGYADWYLAFSAAVCSPRRVPGLGPRPRSNSCTSPQSSPRRDSHRKGHHMEELHLLHNPDTGVRAVDVSCGGFHTLVRMEDGSVFAMGKQDFGILGTGTEMSVSIDIGAEAPVMVHYTPTGANDKSTAIPNAYNEIPVSAVQISTGGWHTAIIDSEGDLYMCGKGEYGRLGLGDEKARMGLTAVNPTAPPKAPSPLAIDSALRAATPLTPKATLVAPVEPARPPSGYELFFHECTAILLAEEIDCVKVSTAWSALTLEEMDKYNQRAGQLMKIYTAEREKYEVELARYIRERDSPVHTASTSAAALDAITSESTASTAAAPASSPENTATTVPARSKVVQVATGGSHSLWFTETNQLYSVGRVDGGRLGVGYVTQDNLAALTILNKTGKRSVDRLLHPVDITHTLHADLANPFTAPCGIADSNNKRNASDGTEETNTDEKSGNFQIIQVTAGGSHSAVLVEYPDITEAGAYEEFLQAIDARLVAEECKMDPKRIPKVK